MTIYGLHAVSRLRQYLMADLGQVKLELDLLARGLPRPPASRRVGLL